MPTSGLRPHNGSARFRRSHVYALCSVFGIPTEEDTDGTVDTPTKPAKRAETKSSVEDIIKGIETSMTLDNCKRFYAKAIEQYDKGTPEFSKWVKVWADKKTELEKAQTKADLDVEFAALEAKIGG